MEKLGSPEFDGDKNNSKIAKEPIATPEDFKSTISDDEALSCLAEAIQNASRQNEDSTQNTSSHGKETSKENPSAFEEPAKIISKEELEKDLATLKEIAHRMSEYTKHGLGLSYDLIDPASLCCMSDITWELTQVASEFVGDATSVNEAIDNLVYALIAASSPLRKSS